MYIFGELTKITIENNVVHTYPNSDFNREGIEKSFDEIYKATNDMDRWVLFEHPSDDAGLTPQSLDSLINIYQTISSHGCIGIAIEIRSVFKGILERFIPDNMDIPILISKDESELNEFVSKVLSGMNKKRHL